MPDNDELDALLGRMQATPRPRVSRYSDLAPPALPLTPPPPADHHAGVLEVSERLSDLGDQLFGATTLDARFAALAHWLEVRTDAHAVFVADSDGLGMVQSNAGDAYVAAAAAIDSMREELSVLIPGVERGNTTLWPSSGQCVDLVWSETRLGRFTVGLVLDQPLEPGWVATILAALEDVTTIQEGRG